MIRIRVFVRGRYVEDTVEVPEAEWEAMPKEAREAYLSIAACTMLENEIEYGARVLKEGEQ
jgi:hypothetical protein